MAAAVAIVAVMSLEGCGGSSGPEPAGVVSANLIACEAYQTQLLAHRTVTTVTTATTFDTIHAMERALAKADSKRLRRDGAIITDGRDPDVRDNAFGDVAIACKALFPGRFTFSPPPGYTQATGVPVATSIP